MNHYINTAVTDLSQARNSSLLQPTTPRPFPVLAYGDVPVQQWYFHNNGTIETWSGDASNGLRVTVGDVNLGPDGGKIAAVYGSTSLPFVAPCVAGDVETAMNGLAAMVTDGLCEVTGTWPNFIVSLLRVGAPSQSLTIDTELAVPASGSQVSSLQTGDATHCQIWAITLRQNAVVSSTTWTTITSGWTGTLSTNTTSGLYLLASRGEIIGDFTQAQTVITVERIKADGTYQTLYQASVILRAKNSDLGAAGSPSFASYLTTTQFLSNGVQNYSSVTGLASAVSDPTKLGGISAGAAGFPVGAVVVLNFAVTVDDGDGTHTVTMTLMYQVQGSTLNSAPLWVRPWNYNAGTNAVAYRLIGAFLDTLPASWNASTSKFHYIGAAGVANAVYPYADQTGTSAPA